MGVEETPQAAYRIDFADRAALSALRMDMDGISAVGSTLEQLAATDDSWCALLNFLESVSSTHGPASYSYAELRGIRFKLHASCISVTPQRMIAVWLESAEQRLAVKLAKGLSCADDVDRSIQGSSLAKIALCNPLPHASGVNQRRSADEHTFTRDLSGRATWVLL